METRLPYADLPPQDVLAALSECLADLVFIVDEEGRYQTILGGNDRRHYHDARHLLGRCFHDVMPAELADRMLREVHKALDSGNTHIVRYALNASDVDGYAEQAGPGAPQWYEARMSQVPNTSGKRHVVATVFNISDRIHTETMLKRMAYTDDLTGLPNRRAFRRTARALLRAARESKKTLAVALVDIDHFKRVNDVFGHNAGDAALRGFASLLVGKTRDTDYLARIGGEEFAFLLPGCTGAIAMGFLERIRTELKAITFHCGNAEIALSFSAGIFVGELDGKQSVDKLLQSADRALYAAKSKGRDRIEYIPSR
ncbi:MAG: GGDEF domain-containing protein [Proteobacteria bacterium]|nr:GGDEF domain-containing protein [Pseudomonadota bacterium]